VKKYIFPIAIGSVVALSGCAISGEEGPYTAMNEDFGKATVFNISHSVSNPERLKNPASIGPANSQAAVGAVERYQKGQVRDIDNDLGTASSGIGK
jgi:type IV pilus biogenesis protein CpaD/CtpE